MARSAWLVVVAAAAASALVTAALMSSFAAQPAAAPALEPSGGVTEQLRQEIQRRDEEIARLHTRLERLERTQGEIRVAAQPQPALASAPAVTQPEAVDARTAAATAWLRQANPRKFGNLTAAEARYLRELDLRGGQVTDADLSILAGLVLLRRLSLRGQPITDAGLAQLAGLEQLESLELRSSAVTGSGLSGLPSGLHALDLTDTQVRPEELGGLAHLQRLQTLDLNRLKIGDRDLEAIGRCSSLRHLELDGTAITDQGVRRLLELNPDLERLEVRSTSVTAQLIAELRQRYPRLTIVNDSPVAWR